MRNPPWTRDELVIALDFYLRHTPGIPDQKSREIGELSTVLNQLQKKMGGNTTSTYRNPNGVYMKLMNFRHLDSSHPAKGLERVGRDDKAVWKCFSPNRVELRRVAEAIRDVAASAGAIPPAAYAGPDTEEGEEGQALTRLHHHRERNTRLVRRKKERALEDTGELQCEVCGFDFTVAYGDREDGFIECHHNRPLSELKSRQTTKLTDLSLVCANCHRMIHRKRPWLSVEELRELRASRRR